VPRSEVAPAPDNAVDELLLADFDRQRLLGQANDAFQENASLKSELDQWRADATALQQQHQQLLNQLHLAAEQNDFKAFAKELQGKIGTGPEDFAEKWLYAEAAQDPVLRTAWDARKENPDQLKAQYFRAENILLALRNNPRADPNQVAQVEQYCQTIAIALESPRILAAARARCVEAAGKFRPVDEQITADVAMVTASMKGASAKMSHEPAPHFGSMSDRELKDYTRQFGF
jgi:hypothetical protein